MVMFSVIVPIYNIEQYLNKCVESILSQTYTDLEIILVDDGSTDSSGSICDEYEKKDNRIKVIHKENGGQGSARQAGVKYASGKYVACIDGDDWISENYFERFVEIIKKYEPDVVCCGVNYEMRKGRYRRVRILEEGLYDKSNIEKKFFPILIESKHGKSFMPSLWAKVFKIEIYKQYQNVVNKKIKIGEDGIVVRPIISIAHSLYIMNDCLYYYRNNYSSLTKSRSPRCWNEAKILAEHYKKYISPNVTDLDSQIYRNIVHNLFNISVSQFYQKQGYWITRRNIKKQLQDSYYADAIIAADYRGSWKREIVKMILKYKLCFPIYIYSRLIIILRK